MKTSERPDEKILETYKLDSTKLYRILKKLRSANDDGFPFMPGSVGLELWGFQGDRRTAIGRLVMGYTVGIKDPNQYNLFLQIYQPAKYVEGKDVLAHVTIKPNLVSLLSNFMDD